MIFAILLHRGIEFLYVILRVLQHLLFRELVFVGIGFNMRGV